jgi:F-type H+-transporting ATPase subunit alpha
MAAFAQFASDLDAATQAQLSRGQRLVEILKQGQYVPLPVEKQVALVWTATAGLLDKIPVAALARWEKEFYAFLDAKHPQVLSDIRDRKINDKKALEEALKKAVLAFNDAFDTGEAKAKPAKKEEKKSAKQAEAEH